MVKGRAMDRDYILNAIRKTGRNQLAGNGVRCCARDENNAGSRRHLFNQHRNGTASRRMLTEVLKRRSERL